MQILRAFAPFILIPLSPAGVLVVDASGPGPWTDLQTAGDSATDGDACLIEAGHYGPTVVDDKDLALVPDTGALVQLDDVIVRNLAMTRAVLLSGLASSGIHVGNGGTRGIETYATDPRGVHMLAAPHAIVRLDLVP